MVKYRARYSRTLRPWPNLQVKIEIAMLMTLVHGQPPFGSRSLWFGGDDERVQANLVNRNHRLVILDILVSFSRVFTMFFDLAVLVFCVMRYLANEFDK